MQLALTQKPWKFWSRGQRLTGCSNLKNFLEQLYACGNISTQNLYPLLLPLILAINAHAHTYSPCPAIYLNQPTTYEFGLDKFLQLLQASRIILQLVCSRMRLTFTMKNHSQNLHLQAILRFSALLTLNSMMSLFLHLNPSSNNSPSHHISQHKIHKSNILAHKSC